MMKRAKIEVELLDHMGSDKKIEQAARLSFHKMNEVRTEAETNGLIRYLMWWRHTSPFEMGEVQFLMKIPLFVARQIIRHRTASVNEVSRRYTSENIEFFDFELRMVDDSVTKQGSGNVIEDEMFYDAMRDIENQQLHLYNRMIEFGVARETARTILDVNLMTTWVWKIDLHNLLHFLNLRLHKHAQKEVRIVAQMVYEQIKHLFPLSIKAFDDWKALTHAFQECFYKFFKEGRIEEAIELMKGVTA